MDPHLEKMASVFGSWIRDKVTQSHQFDVSQANSVRHLAQPIVEFIHRLCREANRAEGMSFSISESTVSTPKKSRYPTLTVKVADNSQLGTSHTYSFVFEGDITLFGEVRAHQRMNYQVLFESIVQRFQDTVKVTSKPQAIQHDP